MPQAAAFLAYPIFGTTVGTILANVAVAYLAGKVLAPNKPTSRGREELKQMVRSGIEPRSICYGESFLSGPIVYINTTSEGERRMNYLHMIICLTTHPIEEISEIFLDEQLDFDLTGSNQYNPDLTVVDTQERLNTYTITNLQDVEDKKVYNNLIRVIPVTGKWMYYDSATTDQDIIDDWIRYNDVKNSINNATWGEDHRLDRCSFVYVRLEYDQDAWNSIPNIYTRIKGACLYNPLLDQDFHVAPYTSEIFNDRGTYSGATNYVVGDLVDDGGSNTYLCYRPTGGGVPLTNTDYWKLTHANLRDNPQLWEYDTNWALCCLDYLLDTRYGLKLSTSGILNEIDWVSLMNAIKDSYDGGYLDKITRNIYPASRFATNTNIATYPKFTVDGVLKTDSTPIDNLETLFTAANGELPYSQGKHFLRAGIYSEPGTDPDIDTVDESYLAKDHIEVVTARNNSALFNSVTGVYVSSNSDTKGEPIEMAPIYDEAYIAEDGSEYIEDKDFPVTVTEAAARNLAKQSLEESRLDTGITLICNFRIFKFKVGDVVPVKLDILGYTDTDYTSKLYGACPPLFKIISMNINEDLSVEVGLQETSYDPYDYTTPLVSNETSGSGLDLPNSKTPIGTPTFDPDSPYDHIGEFYAEFDPNLGTFRHYVDVTWLGPIGVVPEDSGYVALEFGYNLVDYYEFKYCKVADNLTNPFGVLQDAVVTVDISGGKVVSVECASGNKGYGYWADGSFEVDTNYTSGIKAIIGYTVDGYGSIDTVKIINKGSAYTNGTTVDVSSDLPITLVADANEINDEVHKWHILTLPADRTKIQQKTFTIPLHQTLADYWFAVRAVMGTKRSAWAQASKSKTGDEQVYGIPTPLTDIYTYGDDSHIYYQFDLADSTSNSPYTDEGIHRIEFVVADYQHSPTNTTGLRRDCYVAAVNISPGSIITAENGNKYTIVYSHRTGQWKPYWIWARVVNSGGVASDWYPADTRPQRGIRTGLGEGDINNLLPGEDEDNTTPDPGTGDGGGPVPEEDPNAETGTPPPTPPSGDPDDPDSGGGGVYDGKEPIDRRIIE